MSPERLRTRPRPTGPLEVEDLPTAGAVESVASLGSRCFLAVVSPGALARRTRARGSVIADGVDHKFVGFRVQKWDSPSDEDLLLAVPQVDGGALPSYGTIVLDQMDGPAALSRTDNADDTQTLESFAARHLTLLAPGVRAAVLDELLGLLAKRRLIGDAADALTLLRDLVRTRFAVAEVHPVADFAAQIDGIWRVDARSFYIEGWVFDRRARLVHLRLLSPEGRAVEILDRLSRYRRPDVAEFLHVSPREDLGFLMFVELPEESVLGSGWVLQGVLAGAVGFEAVAPPVVNDPDQTRSVILGDLQLDSSAPQELLSDQIAPAIARLQQRIAETIEIDWVDQHGVPPLGPGVSIVIPLYRRIDFLEHQLAQFVLDPEMRDADLIYVLDSPEDAGHLRTFARHLFDLYRVPFRVAALTSNGGYSVANNLGASLARGRLLLMLNSDVLPGAPGWLARLVHAYESDPRIGALAPKLLYEDESIQHAGLYFDRPPGDDTWSNEHYYKGLQRTFPPANIPRSVPAVTGACLMIATALFRELGGLRGIYVRGDYEDSDLCLRLRERGLESWYLPDVELYHLEGQSYPSQEREAASQFNRMLHASLWRDTLLTLEAQT